MVAEEVPLTTPRYLRTVGAAALVGGCYIGSPLSVPTPEPGTDVEVRARLSNRFRSTDWRRHRRVRGPRVGERPGHLGARRTPDTPIRRDKHAAVEWRASGVGPSGRRSRGATAVVSRSVCNSRSRRRDGIGVRGTSRDQSLQHMWRRPALLAGALACLPFGQAIGQAATPALAQGARIRWILEGDHTWNIGRIVRATLP
jgi:hypothetical protein